MHIERYTKLKSGQYKLSFNDGTNTLLHEDLILKQGLLINKELTNQKLEELLEENKSYIAYDLALNYLEIKMRSKKEIKEYLLKKGISEDLINNAVKKLINQGYINDDIYSKAFINDKINLSHDGPYKIKEYLLKQGISEETISKNIIVFDKKLELERINKLIDKQVKSNRNKSAYILKQKVINYLVNLGYSKELVISAVNDIKSDDNDIKKREYDKLYDRLSRKYSGKELEYKLKQKMYQKGFYID